MYIIILLLSMLFNQAEKNSLFQYYTVNRTEAGLVLDRESDRTTTSIAATGFGLYASALHFPCEQTILDFNQTLDTIECKTPARNRGWLYHFMDPEGNPKSYSEVSTIDTVLFWASVKKGAELLKDDKLTKRVAEDIAKINLEFMMVNGRFRHGLYWREGEADLIPYFWDTNSEGTILYRFFNVPFKPDSVTYDMPLFVYYYPLLFYKDEATVNELNKAISWQEERYGGRVGITACDGETGYTIFNENLISPLALLGIAQYNESVRAKLATFGWERTTGSINLKSGWVSKDRIGIDVLSTYILLEGR